MARAGFATKERSAARFELLDIDLLHSHEEIQPALLERVMEQIREDGYVKKPILVADKVWVILDGHHRYEALRRLGCRRVPAYVIDYFSELVDLTLWPTAKVKDVRKQDVVERGRAGLLYTPKTTRHTVKIHLPDVFTDLEDLM
jgi:ParB-like chromosome segregation protein Spo0J